MTPRHQGTELYHCFQRGLDVLRLHAHLATKVREHKDYFERKFERRLDSLMKFIAFIALPTGWMISIYSKGLSLDTRWLGLNVLITAAVLYGGFAVLWYAWFYLRSE